MARIWAEADEKRWQDSEGRSTLELSGPVKAPDLLLRSVVRGALVYFLAVVRYRVRLAATPSRSLAEAINAEHSRRLTAEWLAEDLPDPFESVDLFNA